MQEILLTIRGLSKEDKIWNKKGLELVTSRSSDYTTSSESFFLLMMYYLTKFDVVLQSDFWVIPKITSTNLCKPIHDINYSTFICSLESWKCEREGKKLQKFEYLENKKNFLDEIKRLSIVFWRVIIWWKKQTNPAIFKCFTIHI